MEHSPQEIAQMERIVEDIRTFGLNMQGWYECPLCHARGPLWVHTDDCVCTRALTLGLLWQNREKEAREG